jgi:CheY-like chemotaxis protein
MHLIAHCVGAHLCPALCQACCRPQCIAAVITATHQNCYLGTDDSATNRRLLELMLRNMNARVTLCPDAATALQAWARTSFDLILLDINMPNMAGTELIREIRKTEAAAGRTPVPAIAVTANAMPDQVRDYLAAGFDKCLAKPFTSQSLTAALQDLV